MTNSIEKLLEQIFEKRSHQISHFFNSFIFIVKAYDRNIILNYLTNIARRRFTICINHMIATCNEFRYYTCHRDATMQQTLYETKYKRKMTLKQTIDVEYIVLFFVSLIRLQNRFLTKRFDLYVIMYSNDMIIHLTILRLQTRFLSECADAETEKVSSSSRNKRMCKCDKIDHYTSNELHQETCSKFFEVVQVTSARDFSRFDSLIAC